MKNNLYFLLTLSFFLVLGCSQKSENSQIQLDLSNLHKNKVSAFSEAPTDVYVQVTSPDILQEVYFHLDCTKIDCVSIKLEVPSGKDSLVQLAILTEESGHPKQLFYGDRRQSLIAGIETQVVINLQVHSDFSKTAHWSGRLRKSNGLYPTGFVYPKLHILDKPPMWIPNLNFLMLSGWFQTELFNNFKVSYWLNKTEKLFVDVPQLNPIASIENLNLRGTLHAAAGPEIDFNLSFPNYYEYDNVTANVESQDSQNIYIGYYGSQTITGFCVDNNSNFLIQDAKTKWCLDAACASILNSDIANTGDVLGSKLINTLPVCSAGLYSTTHPILRNTQMMEEKNMMGLQFPLKVDSYSGVLKFIDSSEVSTNNFNINGKFLPDVSSLIKSVEVFGQTTSSSHKSEDFCQFKNSSEFAKLGTLPITQASNSFNGTLNFNSTLYFNHFLCFEITLNQSNIKGYFPLELPSSADALLSISESEPYNYGSVTVGASSSHLFTLTNSGGQTATALTEVNVSSIPFSYTGGSFPGTAGNCASTLASASSCTLDITYNPSTAVGSTLVIDVSYFNGSVTTNVTRTIQGTGLNPAVLGISDGPTYDYGSVVVGSTVFHTFNITNTGGSTATGLSGSGLVAPFQFEGGSYPGTTGTCGATLPAGNNCTIAVAYSPSGPGFIPDAIDMNFNDGVSPQISSRAVQGTGVMPAMLTISDGPTYDYGSVSTSSNLNKTFTITNSGGSIASTMNETGIAAPFMFAGGAYPGTTGTCGSFLPMGGSCTLVINFSPASLILYTDTIMLNYFDGAIPQFAVRNIQGTGIP